MNTLAFLFTLIGISRKGVLAFLNVLPAGVGWFVALVMAFMLPRREPAAGLYPVPVSPVPAGPGRLLVTAHGRAAILAGAVCPWRYR